jgi:hypothetical protein
MNSVAMEGMKSLAAQAVEVNWHSGLPIYACEAFMKSLGSISDRKLG